MLLRVYVEARDAFDRRIVEQRRPAVVGQRGVDRTGHLSDRVNCHTIVHAVSTEHKVA